MHWFDTALYSRECTVSVWAAARVPLLLDSTTSTNDVARQLAAKGAAAGSLVVAREQTEGRGRLERSWHSPEGGLWFSLVLRPDGINGTGLLPLAVAVAVAEALSEGELVTPIGLKWPNDLIVEDKKIAGILLERGTYGVIAGIGVNVNQNFDGTPLEEVATSLQAMSGQPPRIEVLLAHMVRNIHQRYLQLERGDGQGIINAWRHYSITLGQTVRVTLPDRQIVGQAVDIDETGSLWVDSGGERIRVMAGDVTLLRTLAEEN